MQHIINSIRGGFEQFTIEVIDQERNILFDDEAFTSGKAWRFRVHVVKAVDIYLTAQNVADSLVKAYRDAKSLLSCHLAALEEGKRLKAMSPHKINLYASNILCDRAKRKVDDLTPYLQHFHELKVLEVHTESTMIHSHLVEPAPTRTLDIELTAEAVASWTFEPLSFQERRYSN